MDKNEELNMYEILGKIFVHYVADQNLPSPPNKLGGMVTSISRDLEIDKEVIEKAFIFLIERATEVGFARKHGTLGFNFGK